MSDERFEKANASRGMSDTDKGYYEDLYTDLPKEVVDAIMAEHGKAVTAHRQAAQQWEEKYNRATQEHAQALKSVEFTHNFSQAVMLAGGRSEKAISALLDRDALRENPTQEAMERMAFYGCELYRTDWQGNIVIRVHE